MAGTQAKPLNYERLSKVFRLDSSGNLERFYWRVRWKKYKYTPDADGYSGVRFESSVCKLHRVIYCLLNKKDIPANYVVDHIDGDTSNNSISNLRAVTDRDNTKNMRVHRLGKKVGSSLANRKGIYTKTERYYSRIAIQGKTVYLGTYFKESDANLAYETAVSRINRHPKDSTTTLKNFVNRELRKRGVVKVDLRVKNKEVCFGAS